jgi:rhodanese-related sulfurtransferase
MIGASSQDYHPKFGHRQEMTFQVDYRFKFITCTRNTMPELPLEIDVQTLQQLRNSAEPFVLLDVRTPAEYATANITGAVLIPMQEIATRVGELEAHRQQRIVVHCHHGGRSARVTAWRKI